jgi:hypothetical protein
MTAFTDPGEQEHGSTRRKPRQPAPLPAGGQIDLLRDQPWPPPPTDEGQERKEKALKRHEESGRAPLIRFLRRELRKLYEARVRDIPGGAMPQIPFVTADDAVRILRGSRVVPQTDDGKDEPRNWMGAIFKEPGWRYTGRSVPSLRKEANGRHVRCWQWEGV